MVMVPVPAMVSLTVVVTLADPAMVPFTVKIPWVVLATFTVVVPDIVKSWKVIVGVLASVPKSPVPVKVTVGLLVVAVIIAALPVVICRPMLAAAVMSKLALASTIAS